MPKIKIHYFFPDAPRLQLTKTGDWIDLYCAQDMTLHAGDFCARAARRFDAAARGL